MPTEHPEQVEERPHATRSRAGKPPGPPPRHSRHALHSRPSLPPRHRLRDDAGAATAEYLVATMAAVGFAGLLIVILRGNEVRGILTELVRNALSVG